jgi:hypothetical protein
MKKLIQISLVLVLIFGLLQFVAAEPTARTIGSSVASSLDSGSTTSMEGTQMAGCLVRVKGVSCAMPEVGWNT